MNSNPPSFYADLKWPDVSSALSSHLIVLPVGATEQHGPHLPLSVDIDIPMEIAKAISSELDAIIAPEISYGARSLPQSGGGPAFPGTVFIHGSTLTSYYADVIGGYIEAGARQILVINGHYENEGFLFEGIELCRERGLLATTRVVALSWWSMVESRILDELFSGQFPGWHAEHAGLTETALMLYLRPQAVGPDRVDNDNPPRAGIYKSYVLAKEVATAGVLARCSGADRLMGERLFKHVCEEIRKLVKETLQRAI